MSRKESAKDAIERSYFVDQWKKEQEGFLLLKYPNLDRKALDDALNQIVLKNINIPRAYLDNNYLMKRADTDLLAIIDFIHETNPVIGGNGVLFKQHSQSENHLTNWIQKVMANRKKAKKERSLYKKGMPEWAILNALQNRLKLIINSLYGGFGYPGFIFANIYLSTAVTMLGQNAISAAAMGFDAFLGGNCAFVEENEVIRFIRNVKDQADALYESVEELFDSFQPISSADVVKRILDPCTFKVTDQLRDYVIKAIDNCTEYEKILLYYKNNLYDFCETPLIHQYVLKLHHQVDKMMIPEISELNPDAVESLEFLWKMMYTFVLYDYPIYDRIRKNKYTYKKVVAYQDTDSNFLVLGPWVEYIKSIDTDAVPRDKSSDEYSDYIYKVANLMTLIMTRVVTCSFACLCYSLNIDEDHSKKLAMKNEFYFTRILFTSKKKRYVARPKVQEGIPIDYPEDHEYKGFDFIKSTTKPSIRAFYEKIIYEDILTPETISSEKILLKVMMFEEEMRQKILDGNREYFKQSNIKIIKEYANPYSEQGIKGVLLWNTLSPSYQIELPTDVDIIPISLESGRRKYLAKPGEDVRESVWMVKIGIDPKSGRMMYMNNGGEAMRKFAEHFPDEFRMLSEQILLNPNSAIRQMGLNYIARPKNNDIPNFDWLTSIIDVDKIVDDALNLFNPIMKSLGIHIAKGTNQTEHYTNIVSL